MTKRQGLIAQLAGSIEWRLRESRLEVLPLVAFPGWHLRNPRHWGADEVAHSQAIALGSLDGDLMLSSRGLSLECDLAADVFPAEAFGVISEVLRRLRNVSRQFSLSCQVIALSQHGATLGGDAFHDVARDFSTTFVRNYRMLTAITEAHMEAVAAMGPDFRVPVHAEVFLDALDAHIQQDFRKALLYGAIAVEAYAREQLEAAAQVESGATRCQAPDDLRTDRWRRQRAEGPCLRHPDGGRQLPSVAARGAIVRARAIVARRSTRHLSRYSAPIRDAQQDRAPWCASRGRETFRRNRARIARGVASCGGYDRLVRGCRPIHRVGRQTRVCCRRAPIADVARLTSSRAAPRLDDNQRVDPANESPTAPKRS
jgi:hypothetical protein